VDVFGKVAARIADSPDLRIRQGEVTGVAGYGIDVKIAGSSTAVTGVRYLGSYAPRVGAQVWLITDGADMFAIGHLAPRGVPALTVTRSSVQSIGDNADAAVEFTTEVAGDPWGMWDAGASTRLVAPLDGWYVVTGFASFAANATGVRAVRVRKGGSAFLASDRRTAFASFDNDMSVVVGPVELAAAEYVELLVFQNSGGALNLLANASLGLSYIGPAE
jgi:hypothetical protein